MLTGRTGSCPIACGSHPCVGVAGGARRVAGSAGADTGRVRGLFHAQAVNHEAIEAQGAAVRRQPGMLMRIQPRRLGTRGARYAVLPGCLESTTHQKPAGAGRVSASGPGTALAPLRQPRAAAGQRLVVEGIHACRAAAATAPRCPMARRLRSSAMTSMHRFGCVRVPCPHCRPATAMPRCLMPASAGCCQATLPDVHGVQAHPRSARFHGMRCSRRAMPHIPERPANSRPAPSSPGSA